MSRIGTGEQGVEGPYVNLKYITEKGDGKFTGTNMFYYKSMTLTAYYPFTGNESKAPGTDGRITASTGADNQTADNQPKIDFLWDSKTGVNQQDFGATNTNVNFEFAHKMSKLTFTFESSEPVYDEENENQMVSDGVDVRTMISYGIGGLGIEGTFNTATGDCAIDETKREGLTITFEKEPVDDKDKYKYKREFSPLIVFPQKKPENQNFNLLIKTIELNDEETEQPYKCTLRFTDDEIKPGYQYNFTIKVTRRGLIVGELKIAPWVKAEKFIFATIDGEENN